MTNNKVYDYLFVTHLPAFYKVNLYHALAKKYAVFVIFIASASEIRRADFTPDLSQNAFDYCILNTGTLEQCHVGKSLSCLFSAIRGHTFQKVILGGWDKIEFWVLAFYFAKKRLGLALESSVFESTLTGAKRGLKKVFLSRMRTVFASGAPHVALLHSLGYQGEIKETCGVGIFNYAKTSREIRRFKGNFLYVGRLAQEKNIELLLEVFKGLPDFRLTLIGEGPEKHKLKKTAPLNVYLKGYVPNTDLAKEYAQHELFILPSLKEPWGLVVEEALYHGLPVIVSRYVGCAKDWVEACQAGVLFDPKDPLSLKEAIQEAIECYDQLVDKVRRIDFRARDEAQIQKYSDIAI